MNHTPSEQIIPGISLSLQGQATVDPSLTKHLIDLAIRIDDDSKFPVDVEHVLAAIILAAKQGALSNSTDLSQIDDAMVGNLAEHVDTVFKTFGGKVGADD